MGLNIFIPNLNDLSVIVFNWDLVLWSEEVDM